MTDHERKPESEVLPEDVISGDGVPYKTDGAAKMALSNRGLTETHKVVQVKDGWVLRLIPGAEKESRIENQTPGEKVYWVRIRPASNNVSTNARVAMPGVNGEMLQLRRGKRYAVPERFLRAMDATMHPTSRHVLGQDRMETMWVQDDDYEVMGEATWDDFKKWAADTNRGQNE